MIASALLLRITALTFTHHLFTMNSWILSPECRFIALSTTISFLHIAMCCSFLLLHHHLPLPIFLLLPVLHFGDDAREFACNQETINSELSFALYAPSHLTDVTATDLYHFIWFLMKKIECGNVFTYSIHIESNGVHLRSRHSQSHWQRDLYNIRNGLSRQSIKKRRGEREYM